MIKMDLEYRGEGSAAMVFALPKSNEVLRIIKTNTVNKIRKDLRITELPDSNMQDIQSAVKAQLENVIDYIENIMKPLFSHQFVVVPTLTKVPYGFAENALALTHHERPAHRKESFGNSMDSDILWAFLLPDCCFVRTNNATGSASQRHSEALSSTRSFDLSSHLKKLFESQNGTDDALVQCDSENGALSVSFQCDDIPADKNERDTLQADHVSLNHSTKESIQSSPVVKGSCVSEKGNSSKIDQDLRNTDSSVLGNGAESVKLKATDTCSDSGSEKLSQASDISPDISKDFTLSFEIKPKKAYMLPQTTEQGDKPQVCKFCMHQCLKQVEDLITAVKKRPNLYDRDHTGYSNRILLNDSWKKISDEVGFEEILCRKRWKKLRDYFTKTRRDLLLTGDSSKKRKWYLYNYLLFLIPHVERTVRGTGESHHEPDTQEGDDGESLSDMLPHLDSTDPSDLLDMDVEDGAVDTEIKPRTDGDVAAAIASSSVSLSAPQAITTRSTRSSHFQNIPLKQRLGKRKLLPRQRRRARADYETDALRLTNEVERERMEQGQGQQEFDEDEHFFKSLLPKLRMLKTIEKMECQAEIHAVVLKYIKKVNGCSG